MNEIPILYENDEIYVINKPAGLSVQGGEKISHSLDDDFAKQVGSKVFLVHRLDKDTAGLMVVAKSSFAANIWTKLINEKSVQKEYVAICAGTISPASGVIKDSVVQHGETKKAETNYSTEAVWSVNYEGQEIKMTQMRLLLKTGRMHQIRIHLSKNNCPIAGDDQHGNFKVNKVLKKALKIKQLLLASVKLTIPVKDEKTGKPYTVFEIPLPEHMQFQH